MTSSTHPTDVLGWFEYWEDEVLLGHGAAPGGVSGLRLSCRWLFAGAGGLLSRVSVVDRQPGWPDVYVWRRENPDVHHGLTSTPDAFVSDRVEYDTLGL